MMLRLLQQIISTSQTGFVPESLITDNILLAQDLVHDIDHKGKNGNLLMKLDMTKAYDRVQWSFLYAVLRRMCFPEQWIVLVKHYIENSWFSILVNGEPAGFFKSSSGLKQGDRLSPALLLNIYLEGSINCVLTSQT